MSVKEFASTGDLVEKKQTLEILADGVYALTAEGDPNIGAIEGEDFVVCFESLATPVATGKWVELLREHTTKPIRFVVLSHYHAVRALGASAFGAQAVIAHENTMRLIEERGLEDWKSEFARFPRLAQNEESIPGLTFPTITFSERMTIPLGGDRGDLVLEHVGRGHTDGDLVAWLPKHKILFAGDLMESEAALYTGDSFHFDWAGRTLDSVQSFGAELVVGGRGPVIRGSNNVALAIAQSRSFLQTMIRETTSAKESGGDLKSAFNACHSALVDDYGIWPIFEHCLPFNVARLWEELHGIDRPMIWTPQRDREIWAQLQS
ncbi:MBL fold metallo-hydrolase [Glutamicibacter sp.]|uniref:MBL fold metallo-hydrolase n=1 Tax=Glutamicibacter sp. TaxID=1931995 RepID=UPI002B45BD79|nr:MBL fold metallo-hydrolase [Glutamicibacter sp.]HJX78096.1 MBL fold metallo-hydrolase [Glutamicibacter sp.]